jgi:putative flippase GtrA
MSGPQALWAQAVRFATVGGLGTALHYAVMAALLHGLGTGATTATGVGALAGAALNYLLNRRFTFRSRRPHAQALPRQIALIASGWLLNLALVGALHNGLGWPVWGAQVLSTVAVLGWNFAGSRRWVFGTHT